MTAEQANQLAIDHFRAGRLEAAESVLSEILRQNPNYTPGLEALAVVVFRRGQYEQAAELLQTVIRLNPNPAAHQFRSLGEVYRQLRKMNEAIQCFKRAIALNPNLVDAHISLGMTLLTIGDYPRGWKEMEWRWRSRGFDTQRSPHSQPIWNGTDPSGKAILLFPEQGLGDVILFARYGALLAQRGAKVIVGCQQPLNRLLKTLPGIFAVSSRQSDTPAFDCQIPIASLPRVFGTTVQTIPQNVPYLFADPDMSQAWKERLASDVGKLKVGIVWAGSPKNSDDSERSLSLQAFAPLAQLPGVSLYSLQKGDRAAELETIPHGLNIQPMGDELNDFADTAALLANLDLLIAPDTAIVHLAGAMGRPVWTLLRFGADWRWLMDRDDSPWYPTMRLFRQPKRGDWASVMARVATSLSELVMRNRGTGFQPV